jgi:hypothetical protein
MTGSHFVETHRKLFYCGGSCREHLASERRTRKNTHLQSTYVSSTVQDKVTYIKKKEGGGGEKKRTRLWLGAETVRHVGEKTATHREVPGRS